MRIVNMRVYAAAAVLVAGAACSKQAAVESGALLLSLSTAPGAGAPDELRISVYDDTGVLWKDARVPASGALVPDSGSRLGTVLVQPGATSGNLRLHVRGLIAGARALDGLLVVSPANRSRGTFDVTLDPAQLADGDADGVPDAIDDCPATANTDQRGCGTVDGGADAVDDAGADTGADGPRDAPLAEAGADVPADAGTDAATDTRADAGADTGASCGDGGCLRPLGATCIGETECASGYCIDGFCCVTACSGVCRSCNQPGSEGTCRGHQQGTDPNRECTNNMTCNGVGSCGQPPTGDKKSGELCGAGSECTSGYCVDGVCCSSACTDVCRSCATGICTDVRRDVDAPECVAPMTCNSSARCVAK